MKGRHKGILTFGVALCLFAMLAVTESVAQAELPSLEEIKKIDLGFKLFTKETFKGNGRTCSSCHLPKKQYSISPSDIRKLNKREFAKLAVTSKAWGHTPVPGLENPKLLKELGLFNEGPGNAVKPMSGVLETKFQSSPRVAAIELTTGNKFEPTIDQLGWNGHGSANVPFPCDGANGTIFSFAMGAIRQHFTKSLDRVVGKDFRCPTPKENEAMGKFQLWLGRRPVSNSQNEFNLGDLDFKNAYVKEGKVVFLSNVANCNACHFNGGANFIPFAPVPFAGDNANLDTNVEEAGTGLLADVAGYPVQTNPGGFLLPFNAPGGFNIPSVIEAAVNDRFFHNNLNETIEDATAFYFTEEFLNSPGAAPLTTQCDSIECVKTVTGVNKPIEKAGAFQRALSAYYLLRDCERLVEETIHRIKLRSSTKLPAQHCGFNLDNVYKVLAGAQLKSRPYMDVAYKARDMKFDIKIAAEFRIKWELQNYIKQLRKLREKIATVSVNP